MSVCVYIDGRPAECREGYGEVIGRLGRVPYESQDRFELWTNQPCARATPQSVWLNPPDSAQVKWLAHGGAALQSTKAHQGTEDHLFHENSCIKVRSALLTPIMASVLAAFLAHDFRLVAAVMLARAYRGAGWPTSLADNPLPLGGPLLLGSIGRVSALCGSLCCRTYKQFGLRVRRSMIVRTDLRRVFTIGGSDPSGGAGIQADVKTGAAMGVDVATAISAITAQNSLGVQALEPVPLDMFRAQISSVCSDIPVHAVKLGMLYDGPRVRVVIDALRQYARDNIVCDPVLISTSGTPLLDQDGLKTLVSALPLFTLLTPNIPEVAAMTGKAVATPVDLLEAGHALLDLGARAVLVKGGHMEGDECKDVLFRKGFSEPKYFFSRRIPTRNDHGTGCALATSIASGLAVGIDLLIAISRARQFVQDALHRSIHLRNGSGRGSMDLLGA